MVLLSVVVGRGGCKWLSVSGMKGADGDGKNGKERSDTFLMCLSHCNDFHDYADLECFAKRGLRGDPSRPFIKPSGMGRRVFSALKSWTPL